ncbi:hypothetical protein [Acanthopleuribacter pedis]|uniref:Lipoprotein n=1 Tax=Acanthopleuribacter pedis TaxID=442870 RepID=A0A8J7QRQ8_9BACT|nr:hypothetical protein [Acanthopleuribacter pedis]MBO1323020.1 hypothetical protein [Acanthopleuribacter pedis]
MVRTKVLWAFLLVFLPATAFAQRIQPILEPTIRVNADVSPVDVKKVLELTLMARGWRIVSLKDDKITARYQVRSATSDIEISYDAEQISIKYLRSNNLKFKRKRDGAKMIHRDYNDWINAIHSDVEHALSQWR